LYFSCVYLFVNVACGPVPATVNVWYETFAWALEPNGGRWGDAKFPNSLTSCADLYTMSASSQTAPVKVITNSEGNGMSMLRLW